MTREEFFKISCILKSSYPNSKFLDTDDGMEIWYRMLSDLDYNQANLAIQKHISTSEFPPSIASIRKHACTSTDETMKDWSSAYNLMQRAIRRFGSYRESEAISWISEQDKLAGEITRRLGFRSLCESINEIADRANFREAYNSMSSKQKNYNQIPRNVLEQERQLMALWGGSNELQAGS